MADVNLIGDEIHFDGYLVAILVATGIPASVFAEFESGLANATLFETEDTDEPQCPECKVKPKHKNDCSHFGDNCGDPPVDEYEDAITDVLGAVQAYAKGGLLRLADLEKLCKELLEGEQNEASTS